MFSDMKVTTLLNQDVNTTNKKDLESAQLQSCALSELLPDGAT